MSVRQYNDVLEAVPVAELSQVAAPLSEADRVRLVEYWSQVIEAAYAVVGSPELDRVPRRDVRRESSRVVRVLPAARRRVSETSNLGEVAA